MQSRATLICAVSLLIALAGCGGSTQAGSTSPANPVASSGTAAATDFTLAIAPLTVTLTPGGAAQQVAVTASAVNGFTGMVSVAVGSLPAGVTVSPMTLSLAPGAVQQLMVTASSTAAAGSAGIALRGSSGSLAHSITAAVTINAPAPTPPTAPTPTTASLSAIAFDFGNNLLNHTITQSVVTVTNTGMAALTLSPALSGDPSYALVGAGACGAQLAGGGSCVEIVSYTPTTASAPGTQNALLNLGLGGVAAGTPQVVALSGTSAALPVGQVTGTDNPQVALYTMTLPFSGSITVNFGKDTTYGTKTWTQSTPGGGGQVSIFVAGMQASTLYHMQAAVEFTNGVSANDTDHTFTTGPAPANMQLNLTTTTTAGMTPQPGIELLNMLAGKPAGIAVSDLAGNILWTYATPGVSSNFIQGVKVLPNGDFLMAIGPNSSDPLSGNPPGTINEIREINLAGDTVREITLNDVNSMLSTATCAECNVSLQSFHHDVEPLPNGHWLVVANTTRLLSSNTVPALTNAPPANVLGDVIVDLDENLQPVWAWSSFNHLDPNHHPYLFPDWTHTNAVIYSKDDGNLLISMRHENIVYKVDYQDGKGTGAVIWRLGEGGNFTLKGGVDPTDWQYAQHFPAFFSTNTTGVFSLGMMDNGDDRIFAAGVICGAANSPPCLYSTVPIFQIDETAMTATLIFHDILPANLYNFFGGGANPLANGNVEFDLCALAGPSSQVFEVTQQGTPQTVWNMQVSGTYLYRAFRIPSMYPGVQW